MARLPLDVESIISQEEDFLFLCVQTLLNKNRTVLIKDPVGLIVVCLGLNRHCFNDAIQTQNVIKF